MTGSAARDPASGLKEQQKRFADEYLIDYNAAAAYTRAGYKGTGASAINAACRLLANQGVQAYLAAKKRAIADRLEIRAEDVVQRLWTMANADPRELIELQRCCCRYCYGKGNRYQRTQREMDEARAEFAADPKNAGKEFNEAGGIGWNPKREPNPKCPECFGDGEERIVPKDMRTLSPAARTLLAGVKTTQNGLEIKMHDQQAALVAIGRHLGVFKERVEVTGKDGAPVEHQIRSLVDQIAGADTGIGPASGRRG